MKILAEIVGYIIGVAFFFFILWLISLAVGRYLGLPPFESFVMATIIDYGLMRVIDAQEKDL